MIVQFGESDSVGTGQEVSLDKYSYDLNEFGTDFWLSSPHLFFLNFCFYLSGFVFRHTGST